MNTVIYDFNLLHEDNEKTHIFVRNDKMFKLFREFSFRKANFNDPYEA